MLRELNCCQSAERIDNTEQCLLRGKFVLGTDKNTLGTKF